ncbi:MAG: hypothetical protein QNL02_22460, partial [Paracoccaceae bacterium]
DTKKVHQDVPLINIDDLRKILPLGCVPVAIELVEGARPLPEYTHPDRALYIFGPEDGYDGNSHRVLFRAEPMGIFTIRKLERDISVSLMYSPELTA